MLYFGLYRVPQGPFGGASDVEMCPAQTQTHWSINSCRAALVVRWIASSKVGNWSGLAYTNLSQETKCFSFSRDNDLSAVAITLMRVRVVAILGDAQHQRRAYPMIYCASILEGCRYPILSSRKPIKTGERIDKTVAVDQR